MQALNSVPTEDKLKIGAIPERSGYSTGKVRFIKSNSQKRPHELNDDDIISVGEEQRMRMKKWKYNPATS